MNICNYSTIREPVAINYQYKYKLWFRYLDDHENQLRIEYTIKQNPLKEKNKYNLKI